MQSSEDQVGKQHAASRHVVIVGGGAVGLASARAALLRGYRVTVLEQHTVPNPHGASYDQHRMIRFQYGEAEGYTRMVHDAFAAWHRLWADLGATHFHRTGAMGVSMQPDDYVAATAATLASAGVAFEWLDHADMLKRVPQLKLPVEARGLYTADGGVLFADRIVTALAGWVREHGAVVREHVRAASIDVARATVRLDSGETIRGDHLIVAAGAWLPSLQLDDEASAALTHGALPVWRQAVCYVAPPPRFAANWAEGPCLTDIGVGDNYALMPVGGTGLKFGSGAHRRAGTPADGFDTAPGEGYDVIRHFAPYLHDAEAYKPLRMSVGYYVKDPTERFNVQQLGNGIVVTNCDGQMFKFSALMGERVMACLDGELSGAQLSQWAAGQWPAA